MISDLSIFEVPASTSKTLVLHPDDARARLDLYSSDAMSVSWCDAPEVGHSDYVCTFAAGVSRVTDARIPPFARGVELKNAAALGGPTLKVYVTITRLPAT